MSKNLNHLIEVSKSITKCLTTMKTSDTTKVTAISGITKITVYKMNKGHVRIDLSLNIKESK